MDEDTANLFPEHRPPPRHQASWDDIWGPPRRLPPVSGANALAVRPHPDAPLDPDTEVSLMPSPETEPEPEEAAKNPLGEAPEAIDGPSFFTQTADPFPGGPEETFRQFLAAEEEDQASTVLEARSFALPEQWAFSSNRKSASVAGPAERRRHPPGDQPGPRGGGRS